MKSIAGLILPGNMLTTSPFPFHVCQQNRSWIVSRALTSSWLDDVTLEFSKIKEKTIVKVETEQRRILDRVQGFVGLVQRTVNLPNIPIKTETEGSKTIITVELKEGIFCDCCDTVQLTRGPSLQSDDGELLMRINPGKNCIVQGTDWSVVTM